MALCHAAAVLVCVIEYVTERKRLMEAAVNAGQSVVVVCDICLADVLVEELVWCAEGRHGYCVECVLSTTEVSIERGNWRVGCLDTSCTSEFTID